MKRDIINGILLIGALALGSCSTSKLASNQLAKDDDVYFSNAKAGDQPEYVARNTEQNTYNQDRYYNNNDDDYYYYDSYASRINRFGYLSPFGYYNDIYSGYSPYYGSYGLSLGIGYGGYYGYSPFYSSFYSPYGYYGLGYGGGYYGGLGYNAWGTGYGYGNGGYWGIYSASASSGTARPYRAQRPNVPGSTDGSRPASRIGYNGNYPTEYMGRPASTSRTNGSTSTRTSSTSSRGQTNESYSRPQRPTTQESPRPTYQPQTVERSSPPPSSSGSSDGGGRSSSSGGGGRPARP